MSDIVERLSANVNWLMRDGFETSAKNVQCALTEIESLRHKLEMAEACLAGDNALIVGLKNDISEKDAEIARRVTVDEMNAEIESATKAVALYYETQLAASQAREQQLREALDNHSGNYKLSKDECKKINAILDDTQDTTALEAMITKAGEVMRKRCVDVIGPYGNTRYLSSYEEGCEDTKVGIDTEISDLQPITLKDLQK